MLPFKDRADAGKQLAQKLQKYANNPQAIVIGLPRGGVVVAYEVARALALPLDIVVPRKIGVPGAPELAAGALTEDGTVIYNEDVIAMLGITHVDLTATIEQEKQEALRRLRVYRGDKVALQLRGKIVIIVDDGIATGATMKAAIASVRAKGAITVVVAVPVAPTQELDAIVRSVDEVVCLVVQDFFPGIGYFYDHFAQTEDVQVIELLR